MSNRPGTNDFDHRLALVFLRFITEAIPFMILGLLQKPHLFIIVISFYFIDYIWYYQELTNQVKILKMEKQYFGTTVSNKGGATIDFYMKMPGNSPDF